MRDLGFKVGDHVTPEQLRRAVDVTILLTDYDRIHGGKVVYMNDERDENGISEVFKKYNNKVTVSYISSALDMISHE